MILRFGQFYIVCLSLFFLFDINPLWGQFLSHKGNFEVDYITGCSGMSINVTNLDPTANDTEQYNFAFEQTNGAQGFGFSKSTDTTYNTTGSYLIVQVIQSTSGATKVDSIRIEVLPPTPPEFVIQPCAGYQAILDINPGQYDSLRIFYSATDSMDVSAGQKPPNYIYGNDDIYEIRVKGLLSQGFDNCGVTRQTFRTINSLSPSDLQSVQVLAQNDTAGEISLNFQPARDVLYQLQYTINSNNNFQFLQYVKNSTDLTLDSLDNQNNYYCYRLSAYDGCTDNSIHSQPVCSIVPELLVTNNQMNLSWTTSPDNITNYEIWRNGQLVSTINDPDQQQFLDQDILCGTSYCYQITGNYNNGIQSISNEVCDTAITQNTPPPVSDVTASINDNGIVVEWDAPETVPVDFYQVNRLLNQQNPEPQGTTTNLQFLDIVNINQNSQYCYQINYQDICGNQSEEGVIACPVYLTRSFNNTGQDLLSWTEYQGWDDGVSRYVVEKLDTAGNVIESVDVGFTNEYSIPLDNSEQQEFIYQVTAISSDLNALQAQSNKVRIFLTANIFFPNAFTPDNDGQNDEFGFIGSFIKSIELKIFNRWGELVFYSDNLELKWDGNYNFQEAPTGVYVYTANLTDFSGNRFTRSGSIFLIRK